MKGNTIRLAAVLGCAVLVAVLVAVLAPLARAQDPLKVGPDVYKLIFENDKVRVVCVDFKPGDSIGVHSHPGILPDLAEELLPVGGVLAEIVPETGDATQVATAPLPCGNTRSGRNTSEMFREVVPSGSRRTLSAVGVGSFPGFSTLAHLTCLKGSSEETGSHKKSLPCAVYVKKEAESKLLPVISPGSHPPVPNPPD